VPPLRSTGTVLVLTTLDAAADGTAFARALVEERLAACASLLPGLTSIYRWEGGVEEAREQQVILKTSSERLTALEARVRELHPYEVPEFVVLDAVASQAYGAWLEASTSRA
jgi:periplasmic divalent cation tolerance protein